MLHIPLFSPRFFLEFGDIIAKEGEYLLLVSW